MGLRRTTNLFAEVGLSKDENASRIIWDQRLEEELQNKQNSPKLAIPRYDGKVQGSIRFFLTYLTTQSRMTSPLVSYYNGRHKQLTN